MYSESSEMFRHVSSQCRLVSSYSLIGQAFTGFPHYNKLLANFEPNFRLSEPPITEDIGIRVSSETSNGQFSRPKFPIVLVSSSLRMRVRITPTLFFEDVKRKWLRPIPLSEGVEHVDFENYLTGVKLAD